jgi:homocysteine S-methyltransferase
VFPREDECLPDGSNVEQVVEASIAPIKGALVPFGIGMNCTKVHKLSGLINKFGASVKDAIATGRASTVPSLILYPDGTNGEVYNTTTQTWERPEGQGGNQDVVSALLNRRFDDFIFRGFTNS